VYIPYYDPQQNRIAPFHPDFIFWTQKDRNYYVLFVDPKGSALAHYQHKIDGYRSVFQRDIRRPKVIPHNGDKVRVALKLFTPKDTAQVAAGYRPYWADSIADLLRDMSEPPRKRVETKAPVG
jgi:hypothetical protein